MHNEIHSLVRSGSIIPYQQKSTYANMAISLPINSNNGDRVPNLVLRDKSKMPITNMMKIMSQILLNNVQVSYDTMDMIQQSATKYINFVTRKAKDRCQSECRKIMNAEDLLWAIEELGFNDYVEPLTTFIQRYRNIEGVDLFTTHKEPISHIENHGPSLGPEPNLMSTLEMLHPPQPPQVNSSQPKFSIIPNTNLEMLYPNEMSSTKIHLVLVVQMMFSTTLMFLLSSIMINIEMIIEEIQLQLTIMAMDYDIGNK